jgi:hypothetical protein
MSNNSNSLNGGIGFVGLLALLFIGLKLTGYITWSWWWVLSPLWLGFTIGVLLLIIIGLIIIINK